jgi:hypothetical protein
MNNIIQSEIGTPSLTFVIPHEKGVGKVILNNITLFSKPFNVTNSTNCISFMRYKFPVIRNISEIIQVDKWTARITAKVFVNKPTTIKLNKIRLYGNSLDYNSSDYSVGINITKNTTEMNLSITGTLNGKIINIHDELYLIPTNPNITISATRDPVAINHLYRCSVYIDPNLYNDIDEIGKNIVNTFHNVQLQLPDDIKSQVFWANDVIYNADTKEIIFPTEIYPIRNYFDNELIKYKNNEKNIAFYPTDDDGYFKDDLFSDILYENSLRNINSLQRFVQYGVLYSVLNIPINNFNFLDSDFSRTTNNFIKYSIINDMYNETIMDDNIHILSKYITSMKLNNSLISSNKHKMHIHLSIINDIDLLYNNSFSSFSLIDCDIVDENISINKVIEIDSPLYIYITSDISAYPLQDVSGILSVEYLKTVNRYA